MIAMIRCHIGLCRSRPLQGVWAPAEGHIDLRCAKPHGLWEKSDKGEAAAVLWAAVPSGKEWKLVAAAESRRHSMNGDQTALVVQPCDAAEGGHRASSEESPGDQTQGADQVGHC